MAEEKVEQAQHGGGGHGAHGPAGHGPPHEEHEGAPEWLISFADNVMLQMGFFVILFALAVKAPKGSGAAEGPPGKDNQPGPTAEQLDWALAIRDAFNNPVDLDSTDPLDAPLVQRKLVRMGLANATSPGRKGADHDVRAIRPSEYYGLGGVVPFEQGAASLSEPGRSAVNELGEQLRGHRNILEIRGHTNAAEAYGTPDRGAELSYQRARAVAEALATFGLGWDQMRLIACGDNDRVVRDSANALGDRENTRVEVIVTDQAPFAPDSPPTDESAKPSSVP